MRVGIIEHKVDFKCTYDEREEIYNIQIPKRAMAESLINRPPLSKIIDVYLEIMEVEPEKAAAVEGKHDSRYIGNNIYDRNSQKNRR